MVLMPADFPSYGLDEWQAIAGTDEEDRMVTRALMTMQDRVNASVGHRPGSWKTNATFVGSLSISRWAMAPRSCMRN